MLKLPLAGVIPALNAALRTGTLATRFALVFVLAKFLDAGMLGQYGLFTAAIGYALLCFGLDLYVYTSRELVRTNPSRQGSLLRNQIAITFLLYLASTPISYLILQRTGLPTFLVYWFLPILILEHLNQELFRLLIIKSRQITASFLLFLRQGSWAIAVTIAMSLNENARNLYFVMAAWAVAGIFAAIVGMSVVRRMKLGGWHSPVDWRWIRKGIAVSGAFLLATLSVRAIQTVDRFWLQDLAGIDIVGAYVLFFGVASALGVFLDAAIFSFRYPQLIAMHSNGQSNALHLTTRAMGAATILTILAFAVASCAALPLLLKWIGKDLFLEHIQLYYWILAATAAYSLAMVPHYALYAMGHDRPIIASHVTGLSVFVVATLVLSTIYRTYAVPIGVLIAMSVVLLWKGAAYLKVLKDGFASDPRTPLS